MRPMQGVERLVLVPLAPLDRSGIARVDLWTAAGHLPALHMLAPPPDQFADCEACLRR